MATIPINNPQLPFLGLIPGGLRAGVMLRFKGVVQHEGRIQINIQCGAATEPRDDVALHLSIRPKENIIVRNHYTNRVWGTEERYGHSPIYFGQPFDVLLLAEHSQYKIAVNGNHLCTFGHRLPLTRVTYVSISGQGSIHTIGLESDTAGGSSLAPSAPPMGHMPGFPPPGAQVCPMPGFPPYPTGNIYPPHGPPHGPPQVPPYGPPHGGVPVFPGMPGAGVYPPPPPYTPTPYPGYPGQMSGTTTSYPASTDPPPPPHQPPSKGLIEDTKSFINNIIGKTTNSTKPVYPTHNPYQTNPSNQGYPTQPGRPSMGLRYPTPGDETGGYPQGPVPGSKSNGIFGALGGGTAAALLTGVALKGGKKKKLKKNKALKYAAGAGALGLGGYAIHRAMKGRSSSSSSSSSSD